MATIHVGIYARISSEHQRDNTSIDTQLADCKAYAERRGWQVYDTYIDEAKSGRKEQRAEFQRLRKDVQSRRLQAVLVWKVDRLARQSRIQHNFIAELEGAGAIFDSATEQLDLATSGGRFNAGVLAQVAQFQSDLLSERVARALRHKAEQGQWVGPVPLGYVKQGAILAPDEDAPVIQKIFALYATGQHSYTTIADMLNAEGHRAREWQTGARHIFGRENIRTILKNAAYAGFVSSGGQQHRGQHEPLISAELWARCTELREGRTNKGGSMALRAPGLLTSVAYCAVCGSAMWMHRSSRVQYYRCSGQSRRECDVSMQRQEIVDAHGLELLESIVLPQHIIDKALIALQRRVASDQPAPKKQQSRADLEAALGRYAEVYAEGLITKEMYEARKANIITQLQELGTQAPPARLDIQRAVKLLSDMPALLRETSLNARRGIVQTIFEKVWLEDKNIRAITSRQAYTTLFDAIARICVVRVADGSLVPLPHIGTIPRFIRADHWVSWRVPRAA